MAVKLLMTADELAELDDDGFRYELIEGELIRMSPAMPRHGWIGARFGNRLTNHVERLRLGAVFDASTGYRFAHAPDTVLAPDVSFIRRERVPPLSAWDDYFTVAPDLVVEVLSPSERRAHIAKKIRIELAAGVRLLLLVQPQRKQIVVHAPDRPPRTLTEGDVFDAEEVVPGFTLAVSDLFDTSGVRESNNGRTED